MGVSDETKRVCKARGSGGSRADRIGRVAKEAHAGSRRRGEASKCAGVTGRGIEEAGGGAKGADERGVAQEASSVRPGARVRVRGETERKDEAGKQRIQEIERSGRAGGSGDGGGGSPIPERVGAERADPREEDFAS